MVTGPLTARWQVLAAAVAFLGLAGLTACTSSGSSAAGPTTSTSSSASTSTSSPSAGGSPSSAQQGRARYSSAPSLLTQCAISHGVQAVSSSAQKYNASQPKTQQWLTGDKVQLTNASDGAFTDWFENEGTAITLGGQQLGDWQQWAENHDELPAQVCGSTVSGAALRQLYAQVYSHWPGMLGNDPW